MPFHPRLVENQNRGCPLRSKALECGGIIFDVESGRNEIVGDEFCHVRFWVYLGFQPSTPASHGRGSEIKEQRLMLGFGLDQRFIRIFDP